MRYIRTASLKRLFSLRRQSLNEEHSRECHFMNEEKRHTQTLTLPPEPTENFQKPTWKCFSFEEILAATNGFSSDNMVGKGGHAEVFRGILEGGQTIAVKRLTKATDDERKEKEFLTEIGTLGHVSHPNVTALLGCCIDNGLYLIFQFSSKGSVASLLHGTDWTMWYTKRRKRKKKKPCFFLADLVRPFVCVDEKLPAVDWKTRYKIAVGTAKGLHYLHKNCPRRIIHRDIKSSNVLLAADFEPQISDFGLAKWLPSQWSHHSIAPIEGTFGHLAPEYFMHGVVDEKTDVFAFGVFLLELVSGKKPVDNSYQSLHSWAKPILAQGDAVEVIDPRLGDDYDLIQLNRLAFAASLCIRSFPIWRPTMSEVLEVISLQEEILDREKWKLPEKVEEENGDEFWGFEDLEYEDFDEDSCCSFSASSPHDLISTGSSCRHRNPSSALTVN